MTSSAFILFVASLFVRQCHRCLFVYEISPQPECKLHEDRDIASLASSCVSRKLWHMVMQGGFIKWIREWRLSKSLFVKCQLQVLIIAQVASWYYPTSPPCVPFRSAHPQRCGGDLLSISWESNQNPASCYSSSQAYSLRNPLLLSFIEAMTFIPLSMRRRKRKKKKGREKCSDHYILQWVKSLTFLSFLHVFGDLSPRLEHNYPTWRIHTNGHFQGLIVQIPGLGHHVRPSRMSLHIPTHHSSAPIFTRAHCTHSHTKWSLHVRDGEETRPPASKHMTVPKCGRKKRPLAAETLVPIQAYRVCDFGWIPLMSFHFL